MKPRKLTAKEVTFTLDVTQDDIDFRGNAMASGDDAADRELEDEIAAALDRGDIEAWCRIVVKAHYQGFEGFDSLGGCCFLGPIEVDGETWSVKRQINEHVEAHGMREQALDDLNERVAQTAVAQGGGQVTLPNGPVGVEECEDNACAGCAWCDEVSQ